MAEQNAMLAGCIVPEAALGGSVNMPQFVGGGGVTEEKDPTVPAWAKQPNKPAYTAEEVGALPSTTKIPTVPTNVSEFNNDAGYAKKSDLGGLAKKDEVAKTDLASDVQESLGKANTALQSYTETDPTVPSWAKASTKPKYTASEVGADASGTADSKVSAHNASEASHNDIRLLISGLTARLNAIADSDDTTLDQLSEIVAYIKANKGLIDSITTDKVNVADIINNLTTSATNKPLSAKMGVELKALIDAIKIPTSLPASDVYAWAKQPEKPSYTAAEVGAIAQDQLGDAVNQALSEAKAAGTFDGKDGYTPVKGVDYFDGEPGKDGYTPVKGVDYFDGAPGKDGAAGKDGQNGADGKSVTVASVSESSADGGSNVVTFSDGKTVTIKNGSKGSTGAAGKDGADGKDGSDANVTSANVIAALGYTPIDPARISLGIASDGLIYIFVNGTPVGTGIPQGQSGDVFGYVDENNTIVLNGNLADGTYLVKYEMENGTVVNVGNMVLDSNVYYSVTSMLTNCTINNSTKTVVEGGSYAATITAKDGYELKSVTVTMSDSPVSVSGGSISIASVTGNIVITAVAEEAIAEIVNLATPDATATGQAAWESGGWCNNSYMAGSSYAYRAATDGRITTNTIAVEHGDIIYVKGIKYNAGTFPQIAVFDSNKSYVKHGYASNMHDDQGYINLTAIENSNTWQFANIGRGGADVGTRFIRIAGYPSGNISDIIITRNQPIS